MAKGGKRLGAGRPKGAPNKSTAELKAFAGQYSPEAIEGILAIARDTEAPPQARIAAWREVLDRAHGKPAQALTGPDGESLATPPIVTFVIRKQLNSDNQT